jgi:hypothetical protein
LKKQAITLIVDETKDVSKKEQMSLVLRYVHNGGVIELFLCFTYAHRRLQKNTVTQAGGVAYLLAGAVYFNYHY